MRFQQGNKFGRGRPKGSGFVLRCRDWADRKGWDKLEKWADGTSRFSFDATKLLLAYGYGRPVAEIDLTNALESLKAQERMQVDPNEIARSILKLEQDSLKRFKEKQSSNLPPNGDA